jgi:membrane associated rhomboid family serine protease
MLPLYDESAPSIRPPYVTIGLIFLNFLIFILFYNNLELAILNYGTIPNQIMKGQGLGTLLTSMFFHAGILHLIGNMWFLWLFGDNVEHRLGKLRFIIFYLLVGILAGLFHVFFAPSGQMDLPVVGASGAISGLLGAYLVLFPRNKIRALMFLYFRPFLFNVPAFVYVGIWFLYQLLEIGIPTSIAYMAHLGGFVSGMVLVLFLRKKS